MKTNFSKLAVLFSMAATMAVSFTSCDKNGDTSNGPIAPATPVASTTTTTSVPKQDQEVFENIPEGRYLFVNTEALQQFDFSVTYTDAQGNTQQLSFSPDTYATAKLKKDMRDKNPGYEQYTQNLSSIRLDPSILAIAGFDSSLKVEVKAKEGFQLREKATIFYDVVRIRPDRSRSLGGGFDLCQQNRTDAFLQVVNKNINQKFRY